MARCGCQAAVSTSCEAIMLCVASRLGNGLNYSVSTGRLSVKISTDPGNSATFGSDRGLFAGCEGDEGGGLRPGERTVAGLPRYSIGAISGGSGITPPASPEAVDLLLAHRIDVAVYTSVALADDVAMVSFASISAPVSQRTDSTSQVSWRNISSSDLQAMKVTSGTRNSPTRNGDTNIPSDWRDVDGGWYGFFAAQWTPQTVAELLRQYDRRIVTVLEINRTQEREYTQRAVASTIDAVINANAQASTIISVPGAIVGDVKNPDLNSQVADIQAAGITAWVNVYNLDSAGPWQPSDITMTGATGVSLLGPGRSPRPTSIAELLPWFDSPLTTAVLTERQTWARQVFLAGGDVVYTNQPYYMKGSRSGLPGWQSSDDDFSYRNTFVSGLSTKTQMFGALTRRTDRPWSSAESQRWVARRNLPGRWVYRNWSGSQGYFRNGLLIPEINPVPDADGEYRIRLMCRIDETTPPAGATNNVGFFVCSPNDLQTDVLRSEVGVPRQNGLGYFCYVRIGADQTGEMRIRRYDSSGDDGVVIAELPPSQWEPSIVELNQWFHLIVDVRPENVTFIISRAGETRFIFANDTTYRGAYAFWAYDDFGDASTVSPSYRMGITVPIDPLHVYASPIPDE